MVNVRTRVKVAGFLARTGLVVFAVLEIDHLHGAPLWIAFVGYLVAFLALGYVTDDITRDKLRKESER